MAGDKRYRKKSLKDMGKQLLGTYEKTPEEENMEDLRFRRAFETSRRKYLADKDYERDEQLLKEYGLEGQRARGFGRKSGAVTYAEGGMTTEEYMNLNDGGIASKTRVF